MPNYIKYIFCCFVAVDNYIGKIGLHDDIYIYLRDLFEYIYIWEIKLIR